MRIFDGISFVQLLIPIFLLQLRDSLEIDEFLWKYIEKYHIKELDDVCLSGVRLNFSPATHRLEIWSTNRQPVDDKSERIAQLTQRLSPDIVDLLVSLPQDIHPDTVAGLAKDMADNNHCVYFVDQEYRHHIAGPKTKAGIVKQQIVDYIIGNQVAVAQPTVPPQLPFKTLTLGGIHVEIYCGNLLNEKVEATVYPANSHLSHGGGAVKAIADAAGRVLLKECRDYIKNYGPLRISDVMHTHAGNLPPPIRYVIHAAGPPADQFPNSNDLYSAVRTTFDNCLMDAESLKVTSLAIPAIGAGMLFTQSMLNNFDMGASVIYR